MIRGKPRHGLQSWNRGYHESSSRIGQYIHDNIPIKFDAVDIDQVIYAQSTRIIRIIEEKKKGQTLKPSQTRLFPRLAKLLELGVKEGLFNSGSGVFIIEVQDTDDSETLPIDFQRKVFQILPDKSIKEIEVDDLNLFLSADSR